MRRFVFVLLLALLFGGAVLAGEFDGIYTCRRCHLTYRGPKTGNAPCPNCASGARGSPSGSGGTELGEALGRLGQDFFQGLFTPRSPGAAGPSAADLARARELERLRREEEARLIREREEAQRRARVAQAGRDRDRTEVLEGDVASDLDGVFLVPSRGSASPKVDADDLRRWDRERGDIDLNHFDNPWQSTTDDEILRIFDAIDDYNERRRPGGDVPPPSDPEGELLRGDYVQDPPGEPAGEELPGDDRPPDDDTGSPGAATPRGGMTADLPRLDEPRGGLAMAERELLAGPPGAHPISLPRMHFQPRPLVRIWREHTPMREVAVLSGRRR